MSITLSVGVSTIALKLAEFLKVIESTNVKIDKLIHNPFNTAINELNDAKNASSSSVAASLVESARANFARASDLEKNEAQVVALAGLAMCYKFMGDYSLVSHTIDKIAKTDCDYGRGVANYISTAPGPRFLADLLFGSGKKCEDYVDRNIENFKNSRRKMITFCEEL